MQPHVSYHENDGKRWAFVFSLCVCVLATSWQYWCWKQAMRTESWGSRGIMLQLDAQLVAQLAVSNLSLFIITRQAQGWRIILVSQSSQRFLFLSQSPGGLVQCAFVLLSAGFGGCFLLVWHVVSILITK